MSDEKTRHEVLEAVWDFLEGRATDVKVVDVERFSPVDFSVFIVTGSYYGRFPEELKDFLQGEKGVFATVRVVLS
jgi:hypothetical protein